MQALKVKFDGVGAHAVVSRRVRSNMHKLVVAWTGAPTHVACTNEEQSSPARHDSDEHSDLVAMRKRQQR